MPHGMCKIGGPPISQRGSGRRDVLDPFFPTPPPRAACDLPADWQAGPRMLPKPKNHKRAFPKAEDLPSEKFVKNTEIQKLWDGCEKDCSVCGKMLVWVSMNRVFSNMELESIS